MFGRPYNDDDYEVVRDEHGDIVEFNYQGPRHSEYIPPTGGDFGAIGCMFLVVLLILVVWFLFLQPPVGPMNPW